MSTTNGHGPPPPKDLGFGDYPVTVAGRTYTLRMSMAAMIACEEAERQPDGSRVPFHEVAFRAGRSEMTAMRLIFWALLRHHHPEVTVEEAGELFLIARNEGVNVMAATEEAKPEPVDLATLEATGEAARRPRRRPRGPASSGPMAASTGAASTDEAATSASPDPRSSH